MTASTNPITASGAPAAGSAGGRAPSLVVDALVKDYPLDHGWHPAPERDPDAADGHGWGIRLSLTDVSGISAAEVARVVAGQPYASLADFWHRAQVSRPVLEKLGERGHVLLVVESAAHRPQAIVRRRSRRHLTTCKTLRLRKFSSSFSLLSPAGKGCVCRLPVQRSLITEEREKS